MFSVPPAKMSETVIVPRRSIKIGYLPFSSGLEMVSKIVLMLRSPMTALTSSIVLSEFANTSPISMFAKSAKTPLASSPFLSTQTPSDFS